MAIESQQVKIKFSFICREELDEQEMVVKSARDVADETLELIKTYAANQTPAGNVTSKQRDLGSDKIILYIRMKIETATDTQVNSIKTTLRNNMSNLPEISDDAIVFLNSCKFDKEEPEPEPEE